MFMTRKEQDIVQFIEKNWSLTHVMIDSLLQEKGGRLVYKILSDEGVFVFKVTSGEKKEEDMIKDMYIFDFAEKQGFKHIPKLLKTR